MINPGGWNSQVEEIIPGGWNRQREASNTQKDPCRVQSALEKTEMIPG